MAEFRCWAEVDLAALRGNLAWIRHRIGPHTKIVTVVKADAYGHGLKQIAALLMQSGTDIFGVANLTEAHAIRSVGRGWPVLMLGASLPHEVEPAVRDDVMPTISSLAEARAFDRAAARQRKRVDVHLKIDTGMGRLGAPPRSTVELVKKLSSLKHVTFAGIYTHYASAEDDRGFTCEQRARFETILNELRSRDRLPPLVHMANSAGLLHEPRGMDNVVRPGLLVFGIVPPGKRRAPAGLRRHLQPVLSLKCRVSFVKEVPAGTALSYGQTFIAPRRMRVATITAGYGDGFPRAASNCAEVLVGGHRCRVLGRVTMDQTLVDVSKLRSVRAGHEAVLIGGQGRECITVTELAAHCGTVPWEILTNITYRVPRVYRGSHAS